MKSLQSIDGVQPDERRVAAGQAVDSNQAAGESELAPAREFVTSSQPASQHADPAAMSVSAVSRAERAVAEYLRSWGVRDPQLLAVLSRRWANEAGSLQKQGGAPINLTQAAIHHAVAVCDAWLDQIVQGILGIPHDHAACRGLLALYVQSHMDVFAPFLCHGAPIPEQLSNALRGAARAVVPAP